MCSRENVVRYLQLLLKSSHLESTSEQSLTATLSDHFVNSMEPYIHDIQVEVQKFIILSAQNQMEQGEKRCRDDPTQTHPCKRAKGAPDEAPRSTGVFVLTEDGCMRCVVKQGHERPGLEIRRYTQASGCMAPSSEGATLSISEWHALRTALPGLCRALDQGSLSHAAPLDTFRKVSVCAQPLAPLGVFLPEAPANGQGDRSPPAPLEGVRLPAATVKVLHEQAAAITAAVTTAASPGPARPLSSPASAAHKAAGRPFKSSTGMPLWPLGEAGGATRLFACVFRERGHLRVGARAFREQAGVWAPTRHGLNLTLDQFQALVEHRKTVTKAAAGKLPLPCEVWLKDTRKVSVEHACGGALVCLDQCGADVPLAGPRTRVRLSRGEWGALVRAFPQMQATVNAQR